MTKDAWLIVGCAIILAVYLAAVVIHTGRERKRRAEWAARVSSKMESLQHEVSLLRDECARKHMSVNARVSVLERKVALSEAPDPFETILDEEEDE